jgi:hypothetical protein
MTRFIITEDQVLEGQLTPLGVAFWRAFRRMARRFFSVESKVRRHPDDGEQEAGVSARLKPPPPVLSARAAKELPESDQAKA